MVMVMVSEVENLRSFGRRRPELSENSKAQSRTLDSD